MKKIEAALEDSWQTGYGPERTEFVDGQRNAAFEKEASAYADVEGLAFQSFHERGVTPASLVDAAKRLRCSLVLIDRLGGTVAEHKAEGRSQSRPIVGTCHPGHVYLYSEQSVVRSLAQRTGLRPRSETSGVDLRAGREAQSDPTWSPRVWEEGASVPKGENMLARDL